MSAAETATPAAATAAPRRLSGGMLALLAGLAALGTLSTNIILPAFPSMAAALNVPARDLGLTLTSFFLAFALGQLAVGPASDRFGRYIVTIIFDMVMQWIPNPSQALTLTLTLTPTPTLPLTRRSSGSSPPWCACPAVTSMAATSPSSSTPRPTSCGSRAVTRAPAPSLPGVRGPLRP